MRFLTKSVSRVAVEGEYERTIYTCGCEDLSGPDILIPTYCRWHGWLMRRRVARELREMRRVHEAHAATDRRQYQCERCGHWTRRAAVRTQI